MLLRSKLKILETELWPAEGLLSVLEQNSQYSFGLFMLGVGFLFFLHEFVHAAGLGSGVDGLG